MQWAAARLRPTSQWHAASVALLSPRLHAAAPVRWASSKRGGSSSRYMQRQKTDVYVKRRSKSTIDEDDEMGMGTGGAGYVARSAFKLIQLDDRYKFLRPGRVIVDLGAAPGGWSQAIVERVRRSKVAKTPVFALDLLPVADIDGVASIQGDFLDAKVQAQLRKLVADASAATATDERGFVDVVVSDMMANTTGNPITDTEASLELCRAAASFAFDTLRHDHTPKPEDARKSRPPSALAASSSVLVMKYFMSHEADVFRREVLQPHFHFVKAEKMDASRKESREQFWICIGFKGRRPAQSQEQAEL
ncbi:related to MRM2 - mitochondrial rRNA methyl transferase [Moesziomyces antarcticus]|uniref:rRNA methyltransferase 2, mitochondrial n=2 Tax=Pseudozyma antarctica TaxID=84753 RepID=A0A5C3FID0_PSEA2|nr:related to MRM2 - mitochondrial rRNA methyl transferase [Moesziomyces antarcticus]